MDQDNNRDFLGRQYGADGYDGGTAGQYESPQTRGNDAGTDTSGTDASTPDTLDAAEATPSASRRVQVGTVVWGLVLTVLAVLLFLVNTVGLAVDPVHLLLGLTLGAGLALLVGGFLAGLQRNRSR